MLGGSWDFGFSVPIGGHTHMEQLLSLGFADLGSRKIAPILESHMEKEMGLGIRLIVDAQGYFILV